jgi:hypothetical protein
MYVIYNLPLFCKNSGTDWRHGVDIRPYLALQMQQRETDAQQQSTIIGKQLEVVVWAVWASQLWKCSIFVLLWCCEQKNMA